MVRMQLVTDIEWDCDDIYDMLPQRMFVPLSLDEEDIADYLSDKTGWLVKSFFLIQFEHTDMKKVDV